MVLLLLFFRGCGSGGENSNSDIPVRKFFAGGGIENNGLAQTLAFFQLKPPSGEQFEVTVSGLPQDFELKNIKGVEDSYGYKLTVLVQPKKGTVGKFSFKIAIKSKTIEEEYEGSVIVGPVDKGPDAVFGGCEKNGVVGDVNPIGLAFAGQGDIGTTATSNLAASAGLVYAGNIKGELFGFNEKAEKIFSLKVSDYPVEMIQATDANVLVSDILGNLSLFDIKNLKKGKQEPQATYKFSAKLSAPPTVVAKDKIVVANVDGSISMMSLPELKVLWEQNAKGVVLGHVSVFAVKAGNERYATLNFSSGDNSSYIVDEEGNLRVRMGIKDSTKNGTCLSGSKRFFTTKNILLCTDPSGHSLWEANLGGYSAPWQVVAMPERVFVFSDNSIFCQETRNGNELWSQKLSVKIASQPVVAGGVLMVPVEGGLAHVYQAKDGLKLGEVNFGGQITAWPICFGKMIVFADRTGKVVFLGKTQGSIMPASFDSEVVSNGGFMNLNHNLYLPTPLPKSMGLLYELPGNYTKGITTKTHLYFYNMSDKYFVCIGAKTGKEVWRFSATAFSGAYSSMEISDCPMWLSKNGLYTATKQGLVVLDPKTGKSIGSAMYAGLPQSDDTVVALTDGKSLTVLDKSLKFLWKKEGTFFASGICIVGPEIIAFNRDKAGESFVWILDKMTGKVKFSEKDRTIGNGIQMNVSKNYVLCNTPNIWLLDRSDNMVYGASSQAPGGDTMALFPDGRILYKSLDGIIFQFDPKTGSATPLYQPQQEAMEKLLTIGFGVFVGDELVHFSIDMSKEPKNVKPEDIKPEDRRLNLVLARTSIKDGNLAVIGEFVQTKSEKMTLTIGDGIVGMSYVGDERTKLMVFGPR